MSIMQFHSHVGKDGVLNLSIPLGKAEADSEVIVTVQPATPVSEDLKNLPWSEFVARTYGSCAGLGLEEPPDLPLDAAE